VRYKAAAKLLDAGLRTGELVDLQFRVEQLERALERAATPAAGGRAA
jgi:hypothetical protein